MLNRLRLFVAALTLATICSTSSATGQQNSGSEQKPFQLGVEQDQILQSQPAAPGYPAYPSYPTPKPIPARPAPVPVKKPAKVLKANVQQDKPAPPVQRTPVAQNPPPGVLPGQFLGAWLVLGTRGAIEAQPQYQNGIQNIFTASNSQTWDIAGAPGGYSMNSDTGVSQVHVGNCTANTAFIRYEHQIRNTIAREAIVMQISPDGQSFQGLQRISIIKPGEPAPRATVQYSLMGRRK